VSPHIFFVPRLVHFCGVGRKTVGLAHRDPFFVPSFASLYIDVCARVTFHLDEDEYDSWTYMLAAQVLVTAPSSFSLIPALLHTGVVYMPRFYLGSRRMSTWKVFDGRSGELVDEEATTTA
jgi:hypothetical protein